METEHGRAHRRRLAAAIARRFPQFEFAVHELMDRNESFRDICEELLEAETALSSVGKEPTDLRETRRAEWQELIDRSLAELDDELQKYKVSTDRPVR
jgi:hypothetical protein